MPRLNLPIVHIVRVAAIRKLNLKEGIVGESPHWRLPNCPRAARCRADGFYVGNRSGSIGFHEDVSRSKDGREAGGYAMRRPPEVGQAGLVVIFLLGASGCTGFPQRTFGTAPGSAPAEGQSVSPPGLFSWWHRDSSQNVAEETASAGQPETARPGPRYPLANQPTANPWPETQSEWVARNFPRFNRIWNGSTTGAARAPARSGRRPVDQPCSERSVHVRNARDGGGPAIRSSCSTD